jgi:hypothetical protein
MFQGLIAQAVLLAMLSGMFAPLASVAPMPHACCLRHQQHCRTPHDTEISSRKCSHECCRLLPASTTLFAQTSNAAHDRLPAARLISFLHSPGRTHPAVLQRFERGPPQRG